MTDSVKNPTVQKSGLGRFHRRVFRWVSKVIVAVAHFAGHLWPGRRHGVWHHDARRAGERDCAKRRPVAVLPPRGQKPRRPRPHAIPAGLQAGRMFIWLYSIMLPVYNTTGDAQLAFKVGVLAHFIGGAVFIIGAFVVPLVLKIVPAGALFGSLAGGAMAFLILQSMDGTLKMPLVGWLSLIVLFVIYLGKVNTKLPAALIAIVVGAGIAWATGAMSFSTVTDSLQNLGFYIPNVTFGIFSGDVISQTLPFLPIIIVFSLNEVITGIQAVEQAKECGDTFFTTTKPLVLAGVSSMVGALFGNPLAVGLYWGYPGWKKMGSGTGYHLGIVVLYALVGLTGLSAIITAFIPEAVVLPILVFVGISQLLPGLRGGHQEVLPRGDYGLPARGDGLYHGQRGRGQAGRLLRL